MQRPFVWKRWQVRDFVDSLYQGYPTGYLIISKSPDLKLKDGSLSVGKKIMIDGQQRVTAMMTALAGFEVFNADFEKKHIAISYNPFANFTYLDTPTNIAVGKDEPSVYFSKVWNQLINQNYVRKTFSFYKSSDFMQFSIDKKSNVLRPITNNREKIVSENWIYLKEQKIKKSCATSMCHTA